MGKDGRIWHEVFVLRPTSSWVLLLEKVGGKVRYERGVNDSMAREVIQVMKSKVPRAWQNKEVQYRTMWYKFEGIGDMEGLGRRLNRGGAVEWKKYSDME